MKLIIDIECGQKGKPYNIGYIILKKNKIIKRRNIVILENIYKGMQSHNLSFILNDLSSGAAQFTYLTNKDFIKCFTKDLKKYNITKCYGFNVSYDRAKLNLIHNFNLTYIDLKQLASKAICLTKEYINFCFTNNLLTNKGKPKKTLEVIYQYLTNDLTFQQAHNGLADCLITFELYKKLRED